MGLVEKGIGVVGFMNMLLARFRLYVMIMTNIISRYF